MIENNYIELGKRAVASKGFLWMPGMADCWGGRVREGDGLNRNTAFPDLRDPATLGCLLALVREAWGEPTYLPTCLDVHDEAWVVRPPGPLRQTRYESYASVLVAALEAAP